MSRDELDRYYTPRALARAVVDVIAGDLREGSRVLEPHSGGGAFVDELVSRGLTVDTCDLDPDATRGNGDHHVGDFLGFRPARLYSTIVGNPPFGEAQAHISHALSLLEPDGLLAMLVPLPLWGSGERLAWWQTHTPSSVHVAVPRPSFTGEGSDMQEIALYVWWADELRRGQAPALRHLPWSKPPAAEVREHAAGRRGGRRQTSIFDRIEAAQ